MMIRSRSLAIATASLVSLLGACTDEAIVGNNRVIVQDDHREPHSGDCLVDKSLLVSSVAPDAIPALTLPNMVSADHPDADYLDPDSRVLGIVVSGEARAYPHNILWWHEIVNDRIGDRWVSVTFCPLTGSGLAFDPHIDGTRLQLGVSGLLFANNLVLYDRVSRDVYGPQLSVQGKCQGFQGRSMPLRGVQEMAWGRWVALHPDTKVVAGDTGFDRPYRVYPYGSYDQLGNDELLVPMAADRTRPIKERILAIRGDDGSGRGYPFGELRLLGPQATVNEIFDEPYVVFYDSEDGETAIAHSSTVNGARLFFEVAPNRLFRDTETGSLWTIGGEAVSGPLDGSQLAPMDDAYVLFWFAWRHFQPDGRMFHGG
jgi:hypothetical protein